jgi:hypothetical protein
MRTSAEMTLGDHLQRMELELQVARSQDECVEALDRVLCGPAGRMLPEPVKRRLKSIAWEVLKPARMRLRHSSASIRITSSRTIQDVGRDHSAGEWPSTQTSARLVAFGSFGCVHKIGD